MTEQTIELPQHEDGGNRDFDPIAVKHLELIQTVIGRLATDSFLMKGWAITVAGAFYGFAAKDLNWRVALIGLMPTAAFWLLDAYFLSRERMYRALYEAVRIRDDRIPTLSMDYRTILVSGRFWPWQRNSMSWWRTFWSTTLWMLYVPIIVVGIVLTTLAALH